MPPVARNSRDVLQSRTPKKKHRTGRYIAVGAFLIVTLLTLHHVLLRDASKIAGIFVPTIIMGCYILWIAYSARRDKLKVRRRRVALAMQLTEVISNQPLASVSASATPGNTSRGKGGGRTRAGTGTGARAAKGEARGGGETRTHQVEPMTFKHNIVMTSVNERPVILSRGDNTQDNININSGTNLDNT
ncbi:uncharacterized protein LOC103579774 isoform X1 [Microplitis demolitor]|uniref:uncharacterized protein LOC103579774 isoform X1 n=1 Tax=Microplitis demolitor TaxID=69319 RepID=UPI0004CCFAAF|nr:uncharacterized protein LOC103579774 isoform X1 [Microplitis demolitor]